MVHFYLGMSHLNLSKNEDAIKEIQEALELSGSNLRIKSWLGYTSAIAKDKEKALRILDEIPSI